MVNIIKKELFYLSKMKNVKACAIISISLTLISIGMNCLYTYFLSDYTLDTVVNQCVSNSESGFVEIFLSITIAINICYEYESGFIKNVSNNENNQKFSLLGKMIGNLIVVVAYIAIPIVVTLLYNLFTEAEFGNGQFLGQYLLCSIVLYFAFACVLTALAMFLRKKSAVLTISLIYSLLGCSVIWMIVDNLVNAIFNTEFSLENYTPLGLTYEISYGIDNSLLVRSIIVGVIYIVLMSVISKMLAKRSIYE